MSDAAKSAATSAATPAATPPATPAADVAAYLDEIRGYFIDELAPGMQATFSRTVTEADIVLFAGISGDFNPLHLNREFAETTRFGGPIAHGMLTASLISTVVGTKLPGPGAIYMEQSIRFTAPVKPGDTVTARAVVSQVDTRKRRCRLTTACTVRGRTVVEGEALLLIPARPQVSARPSDAAPIDVAGDPR